MIIPPRKSLSAKLIRSFSLLFLLTAVMSVVALIFLQKSKDANALKADIDRVLTLTIDLIKTDKDFFVQDAINPAFYELGGQSPLHDRHLSTMETINSLLLDLGNEALYQNDSLSASIVTLRVALNGYNTTYGEMFMKLLARGFMDEGQEGQMRTYAHALEEAFVESKYFSDLLMLRRHEKDFMLRQQDRYVLQFQDRAEALMAKLNRQPSRYSEEITLLNNYQEGFASLVLFTQQLGLEQQKGLKLQLNLQTNQVEYLIQELNQQATQLQNKQLASLRYNLLVTVILCLLSAVGIGLFEARKLARPIRVLKKAMHEAAEDDFKKPVEFALNTTTLEVQSLGKSFREMLGRIQVQLKDIEASKEELSAQNDQLQVLASELQESNGVKDKFFSIIAHDVKGPIATLSSFLDLLITLNANMSKEETTSMAKEIQKSLKNLSHMLENLLEWSRSQMGTMEFNPVEVDLYDLISKNIDLYQVRGREKGISIVMEAEEGLTAKADFNMVDFIVRNLIGNALKFTLPGGSIWVSAQAADGHIQVSVRDNGVGISQEDQAKLFRPDQHVTRRGTGNEKGTGLGLILCQEFVQRHGGEIWLESIPQEGTTFFFTLQPAMQLA